MWIDIYAHLYFCLSFDRTTYLTPAYGFFFESPSPPPTSRSTKY